MPKFKIYAGLGGGFGGANFIGLYEFDSEDEAEDYAYEQASEKYESYAGYHGLQDWDEVKQELIDEGYDADDEDVQVAYNEAKESWLDYKVKQVPDDYEISEDDY